MQDSLICTRKQGSAICETDFQVWPNCVGGGMVGGRWDGHSGSIMKGRQFQS